MSLILQNAVIMKCELEALQSKFEESLASHQSSRMSLMEQIRELSQQKAKAKQEVGTISHCKIDYMIQDIKTRHFASVRPVCKNNHLYKTINTIYKKTCLLIEVGSSAKACLVF